MGRSLPVLNEGTRVQVEGNGEGVIQYCEFSRNKMPQYTIKLPNGNTASVTYDKLYPLNANAADTYKWAVSEFKKALKYDKLPGPVVVETKTEVLKDPDENGIGYRYKPGKTTQTVGPAPDLMGAAARHTGVVRAVSDPKIGDLVCMCRHPLQNVPGHPCAVVVGDNGTIERYVLKDVKTGAYSYANTRQITVVQENAQCPYDGSRDPFAAVGETLKQSHEEIQDIQSQAESYYWGFKVGDDVAVRGWGAGKIHEVHTDQPKNKKPIVVRTARGQLINCALHDLTKIQYGSVFPPLVEKVDSLSAQVRKLEAKLDKLINNLEGDGK